MPIYSFVKRKHFKSTQFPLFYHHRTWTPPCCSTKRWCTTQLVVSIWIPKRRSLNSIWVKILWFECLAHVLATRVKERCRGYVLGSHTWKDHGCCSPVMGHDNTTQNKQHKFFTLFSFVFAYWNRKKRTKYMYPEI